VDFKVTGYSERGVINSLIYNIFYSKNNLEKIKIFLSMICLPNLGNIQNNIRISDFSNVNKVEILIEQSFSDFGDCDLVILVEKNINSEKVKQAIFVEAKVKTYRVSRSSSWSIAKEYDKFKNKNTSSLFFQLYSKMQLIELLKSKQSKNKVKELNNLLNEESRETGYYKKRKELVDLLGIKCDWKEGFWLKRDKKGENIISRKLGGNIVVLKAAEKLSEYCIGDDADNALFVALLPEERKKLEKFFKEKLKPLCIHKSECCVKPETYYRWGFITWNNINDFCNNNGLSDAESVFKYNKWQIY
jgi:hypothetical protein